MNAETAADNPEEADQAVESVRENPRASLIDKAIADAVSLQQQDKKDDAVKKWRAIVDIAGERDNDLAARAWFSIGYLLRKDPEVALDATDRAIRLKPDHATAYNNRGAAKRRLARYDEAIADFDMAIHLKPKHIKAHINRGISKVVLGLKDKARKDLETGLKLARDANKEKMVDRAEKALRNLDNADASWILPASLPDGLTG